MKDHLFLSSHEKANKLAVQINIKHPSVSLIANIRNTKLSQIFFNSYLMVAKHISHVQRNTIPV